MDKADCFGPGTVPSLTDITDTSRQKRPMYILGSNLQWLPASRIAMTDAGDGLSAGRFPTQTTTAAALTPLTLLVKSTDSIPGQQLAMVANPLKSTDTMLPMVNTFGANKASHHLGIANPDRICPMPGFSPRILERILVEKR